MEPCPILEIGEALEPFIRTRKEVDNVRNNLQAYLEKHMRLEGEPLSLTNLTAPPLSNGLGDLPSGLSGTRKAYWKALAVHLDAKAKYESLKSELSELSRQTAETSSANLLDPTLVKGSYLPLLRQREKQRRLYVVEKALSAVEGDHGGPAEVSLDDLVRSQAGEMPRLPTSQASDGDQAVVAEEKLLELKKAVLTAKRTIDQHEKSNGHTDGPSRPSSEAELYALQKTRNELIKWIESKLAIIGTAQAANEKQPDTPVTPKDHAPIPVSMSEIEEIYEQYLLARRTLLETLQNPMTAEFTHEDTVQVSEKSHPAGAGGVDKGGAAATAILPFIPALTSMKQQEQTLSQQMAYSRRQLSTAESETERLVHRLADESHLVQPGASKGDDWAAAAGQADKATARFVQDRSRTGESFAASARQTLEDITEVPHMLEDIADNASS